MRPERTRFERLPVDSALNVNDSGTGATDLEPTALEGRPRALSHGARIAFGALILERALPNFFRFAADTCESLFFVATRIHLPMLQSIVTCN